MGASPLSGPIKLPLAVIELVMPSKHYGLVHTLPGAPPTPHCVVQRIDLGKGRVAFEPVPGFYRTDVPTPIGGEGELDINVARKLADDPGVHLKLVELTAAEALAARKQAKDDLKAVRRGQVAMRREESVEPKEEGRLADEAKALTGGKK